MGKVLMDGKTEGGSSWSTLNLFECHGFGWMLLTNRGWARMSPLVKDGSVGFHERLRMNVTESLPKEEITYMEYVNGLNDNCPLDNLHILLSTG